MSTQKRFGPDNPLLRRVRRHATMATLFRAADPAATHQAGPSHHSGSSSVVRATIVPQSSPEPATEGSPADVSRSESPPAEMSAAQVRATERLTGREEASSAPAPSIPRQPSDSSVSATADKTPASSQPPESPSATDEEEDESAWRRLQAIFRGHRQKESVEAGTADPPASPPAEEGPSSPTVQRQEAEPPAAEPATSSTDRDIASSDPAESSQETAVPPTSPTAEVPAKQADTPTSQPQTRTAHAQRATADETTVGQEPVSSTDATDLLTEEAVVEDEAQIESPPTTSEDLSSTAAASSSPDVQRQVQTNRDETVAADTGEADTVVTDTGNETRITKSTGPPDVTAAAEAPAESAPQSLPLEAVWPVQRKKDTAASPPTTGSAAAVDSPPPSGAQPEEEQVRSALQRVASGQPSYSSVELVGPRRPRPPAPKPRDPKAATPPPEASQTEPESKPDSQSTVPAPPAPETRPAPETTDAIPTEIGPLPADLWQLLGETPPAQPAADAPQTVMRATETAEPASQASIETSAESVAPPLVQRQATLDTIAESESLPGKTEAETEPEERELSQADLDELARRVYSDIKRRLGVEWERVRGRL